MDELTADASSPPIRLRTPHLAALVAALDARDHRYEVVGPDVALVHAVAADDLGWLAAAAGVVTYEMSLDPVVPCGGDGMGAGSAGG